MGAELSSALGARVAELEDELAQLLESSCPVGQSTTVETRVAELEDELAQLLESRLAQLVKSRRSEPDRSVPGTMQRVREDLPSWCGGGEKLESGGKGEAEEPRWEGPSEHSPEDEAAVVSESAA